jgi:hypothetical protein
MSRFSPLESSGAPTFTAASASVSLSGRDPFIPSVAMDPTTLEAPDWYHQTDTGPVRPPQHEHYQMTFGFASHGIGANEALHRRYLYRVSYRFLTIASFLFLQSQCRPKITRPCASPMAISAVVVALRCPGRVRVSCMSSSR